MQWAAPRIPYISNLTGTWIDEQALTSPEYWLEQMCRTVRFADGIGELLKEKERVLIEVGAGQSLGSFVKQHPDYDIESSPPVVAVLRAVFHEQSDEEYLQAAVAKLWLAGIEPDWKAFYATQRRLKVPLPTYAFERQRYWIDAAQRQVQASKPDNAKKTDITQWFYRERWYQALRQPGSVDAKLPHSWLLLLDEGTVGRKLAAKLRMMRKEVITVAASEDGGYSHPHPDAYLVDPQEPAHLKQVIGDLREQGFIPGRIVHLWNLTDEQDFDTLQAFGFLSLITLAQALGENRFIGPLQLDVVSNGMYVARADDIVSAPKGTSVGAYRTIGQEYPNITVRSIDFASLGAAAIDSGDLLGLLIEEVTSESTDTVIAYRGGERLVQVYESLPVGEVPAGADVLREGGTYLLTGGLGNAGLTLAGMLTKRYKANVALVSRRAFPQRSAWRNWLERHTESDEVSRTIHKLQGMEETGGRVIVFTANVADRVRMGEIFAWLEGRYEQVHGIFHAAGIITADSHDAIAQTTRQKIDAHFAAKVRGTLVLAQLLESRQPDFCLLFSSISVTLGGLTLAAYAAANSFEDSFALARREMPGTRWIAVNWDTWAREHGKQDLRGTTLEAFLMSPDEGAEAVRRVLSSTDARHLINSTGDLRARLDQWVYRKPLQPGNRDKQLAYYARPALANPYVAAANHTEKRVARVFQNVLGIEKVGLEDNFFELGGNSLIALQVIAELQRECATHISPILLFEAPNVAMLAKRLAASGGDNLVQHESAPVIAPLPVPPAAPALQQSVRGAGIAIIGMAGRFPGASSIEALWEGSLNGVESLTRFSDAELREAGIEASLIHNPDYVKVRGIVAGIDQFDAGVFGFTPREAELLDPQHRVMLEMAWAALEGAGYDSQRYSGRIGMFAGARLSTYKLNLHADRAVWESLNTFDAHIANEADGLATRISYKLNLSGPSVAVQTFCSSSAVAIHLACQSLRTGESQMALAGGVALLVPSNAGPSVRARQPMLPRWAHPYL